MATGNGQDKIAVAVRSSSFEYKYSRSAEDPNSQFPIFDSISW